HDRTIGYNGLLDRIGFPDIRNHFFLLKMGVSFWKDQFKRGTAAYFALHLDLSLKQGHKMLDHFHTDTGSPLIGLVQILNLVKPLEYSCYLIFFQSRSGIGNNDLYPFYRIDLVYQRQMI